MKATVKNLIISVVMLSMILVILSAVDAANHVGVTAEGQTKLRVQVLDLDGQAVHNAKVTVAETGASFNTDNKGMSPQIEVGELINSYDKNISDWFCVTVKIEKDGFVDTVIFNCVLYSGQVRNLTVKTYKQDDSSLPYVCYVESPPDSYIKGLFEAAEN